MNWYDIITDIDVPNDLTSYLVCLDTAEGYDCVGHWMFECATYLPNILKLKNTYPSLKILLKSLKLYKLNTLIDFGFTSEDIILGDKSIGANECKCHIWHSIESNHLCHGWVTHELRNHLTFIPHFCFANATHPNNKLNMENLYAFKSYYGVYNPPIKTIDLLYICKSKIENYIVNRRTIINRDEIQDILKKHGAIFLETDNLKSIKEQIDIVLKAKIIVYEFGSALINSSLFANSSHSLVLNKIRLGQGHLDILRKLRDITKEEMNTFGYANKELI